MRGWEKLEKHFRKNWLNNLYIPPPSKTKNMQKIATWYVLDDNVRVAPRIPGPARSCAEYLISHGADVDQADTCGERPILNVADYGDKRLLRLLLDKNANPNAANEQGNYSPIFPQINMSRFR